MEFWVFMTKTGMFMPVPKLICLPLPCSFEGRPWVSATSGVVFRWNKMSYHRPQTIREMWYPWGSWHSKPKAILFLNAGRLSIPRKENSSDHIFSDLIFPQVLCKDEPYLYSTLTQEVKSKCSVTVKETEGKATIEKFSCTTDAGDAQRK